MKKTRTGFQVTLNDIAKKLHVSKVTVSKALRGHPDISSETAEKIKATARALGYSPNFMARNLSSRRTNAIGVIVPKIAHHFFSSVIEGIYDTAFQNGYEVLLTVSQENAERELQHINSLLSMRVDGLIISVSEQTRDYSIFKKIKEMGVPLTFMDRVPPLEGFNTVVADDRGGARAATEHILNLGYTKIAHLGGHQYTSIGRERWRGFADAMKHHGITVRKDWIVYGGFSEAEGYKGFKMLYETGKLPEVVFAVTFPVALGVYRAVREMGMKIPDDIDIICFGNSGMNHLMSPSMSYVDQPTYDLGRRALEVTLENIQKKGNFLPQHITLPTKLVLCDTCTKKRARGKSTRLLLKNGRRIKPLLGKAPKS